METLNPRRAAPAQRHTPAPTTAPAAFSPGASPRRRTNRIILGIGMVIAGGFIAALVVQAAANRTDVVAVARDVQENQVLVAADLRVVQVGSDSDVETVPASQIDDLVGRVAGTDLVAGAVLALGQVRAEGDRLVQPNEEVVGLLLSAGDAPLGQLSAGQSVKVVVRPSGGTGQGEIDVIEGWLLDTSAAPLNNGDRPVSVVVPDDDVGDVSAAAAEDRVTLGIQED